jgi:hypothetical protein
LGSNITFKNERKVTQKSCKAIQICPLVDNVAEMVENTIAD